MGLVARTWYEDLAATRADAPALRRRARPLIINKRREFLELLEGRVLLSGTPTDPLDPNAQPVSAINVDLNATTTTTTTTPTAVDSTATPTDATSTTSSANTAIFSSQPIDSSSSPPVID